MAPCVVAGAAARATFVGSAAHDDAGTAADLDPDTDAAAHPLVVPDPGSPQRGPPREEDERADRDQPAPSRATVPAPSRR